MIIKCDAASLEWRVKAYLAQDKVAIQEIKDGLDMHTHNQKSFNLPSRLIAKVFVYRMVFADAFGPNGYSSPAYAYANDADFMKTSTSPKFWEKVIDKFFTKYEGVRRHGIELIQEATSKGILESLSGRYYPIEPYTKWNGDIDWPRTKILNYPVQGLAADFMQQARLDIGRKYWSEWRPKWGDRVLLINTVHDDVEMDVDNDPEIVYNICIGLIDSFRKIPKLFESKFGVEVNVPMDGECKFGPTLAESGMTKFNLNSFEKDWNAICS